MAMIVKVIADGKVLRPEQAIDLQPNTSYLVTIAGEAPSLGGAVGEAPYLLPEMAQLATGMGATDRSALHDRYAHGNMAES